MTPFGVKNKVSGETIPVPCGKCPDCVKRRVSQWSFRLLEESKISSSSHFITLTYDSKFVPITKNGFMSLSKHELQKFMKRLRKANSEKLKYYAVGEYGTDKKRPHYHILLFNAKIETIDPAWNMGYIDYGKVEGASVGYTLKYMSKGRWRPMHCNDDREPQFAVMSKGLGLSYCTEESKRYHLSDLANHMCCVLRGGQRICMPRYYKEKLYTDEQRKALGFWARKAALEAEEKAIAHGGDTYFRDLWEAQKAAFARMEWMAKQGGKI